MQTAPAHASCHQQPYASSSPSLPCKPFPPFAFKQDPTYKLLPETLQPPSIVQPPCDGFQLLQPANDNLSALRGTVSFDSFGLQPTTASLCMTALSRVCDSLHSAPDSFTMQQQHRASAPQHSTSLHAAPFQSDSTSPCSLQGQHIASACQPVLQLTAPSSSQPVLIVYAQCGFLAVGTSRFPPPHPARLEHLLQAAKFALRQP